VFSLLVFSFYIVLFCVDLLHEVKTIRWDKTEYVVLWLLL